MNRIWISTDWHLYSYDNDSRHPFRNARNLGKLAQNFAEEISEDDLFLFLGDLCDPGVSDTNNIKNILSTIDGYNVMCRGNHDTEEDDYYIDLGFDAVTEITRIHNILFSHKPIRVLPEEINIHGHLHTEKLVTSGHQHINAYGTNWNTTDKPILLEELLTAAVHQVVELPKREENHITEKFEKYTSFENDVYTKILDLSDEFSLAPMDEATNSQVFQELNSMNTPNELYDWMRKNIRYANFTRLKSQAQMIKSRSGSCHDQVAFAYPILRAMENVNPRILFFIATNPDKGTSGQTHSLIWWSDPADKKVYWFENSWGGNQGIHKFDSEEDMKASIEKRYKEGPEAKNYPELVFKSTSIKKFKEGITLGDLVNDVYHGTDANEAAVPSVTGDAIDEILFPDVEATQYWLADDESYRKKAEKAEEKAKDTAGIALDESVKHHNEPLYFVSSSNMHDDLYPAGKCIFTDMDAAISDAAMDIKRRYPDENVFPLELYVHRLEPGYYELRVSDEVGGAYWSIDNISLECLGKVTVTSPSEWAFNDLNEAASSFKEVKRIVNNIPKEEHHWFYHGETFKDSPYVKYRKVMYLPHVRGKVGGFIDVYTFSSEPETGIIVIAVEPAARGTGLSQKLVQKTIEDVPSLGIKKLIWRADTDNVASIKLAQKMGFTDISDLKKNPDQYKYEMVLNEAAKSSLKVNTSLYFISKDRLDESEIIHPRIPDNYMTQHGYEDNKTPRVCFSTSIDGCLTALGMNVSNQKFYVYHPISDAKVITPTEEQVPDASITKERWICEPVQLHYIGAIKAIDTNGPHDDGTPYRYGKNKEFEARLYHWDWKWLNRPAVSRNISESASTPATLYHGSPKTFKVARVHDSGTSGAHLFATSMRSFALAYAGAEWSDFEINQSRVNGDMYLTEILPGKFREVFSRPGYLHILPADTFKSFHGVEFISDEDVRVQKTYKINNVLKELQKAPDAKLYYYPDLPPFIQDRERYLRDMAIKYNHNIDKILAMTKELRVEAKESTNPNDGQSSKAVELTFYLGNDKVGEAGVSGYDTGAGFLYDLEVVERFRGKGYSKQILDYVMKNYSVTDLSVAADNKVAINLYEKFGFKLKKTFNFNGENGYEKGRFRWYQLDESAGVINEMAYEDYCDCFYVKLRSLAAQYNKRDDIFKHVAKVLKMEQEDLPKFDCHIQVSGKKQLCFSLVNSDTPFEIRCEYETYLKEMIEDLEKDADIKTKCPHIKSIWTADAEGTIYVNLDYEHINEAIADTHSLDREQKKRIADKYGLRDVGNSHEEEEAEAKREKQKQKERELDEKRKKRLKQLEKARAKQKRDRFFKSMKSKIPGVKNEDADTVDASEAEYLDDLMCEYDNVRGEQKRVFDDPRRYADAALDESIYTFEMVDKIQFFDRVDEAAFKAGSVPKLYPVYIMLMHSGTALANAIKTLTQSQFSHSSISFDSSMKSMYSFGRKTDVNPFIGGFKKENINDKFFKERNIPYALYVIPCTEDEINRMKKRLDYFIAHATKFKYDFTGLFKNYFGIADNPEYKWFCSRFVADILNFGRPSSDPYIVEPSLMKPEDFTNTTFATYVTGGFLSNYDQKTVDTITKRIIRAERIKRSKIKTVEDELVESVYDLYPENPWSRVILECQLSLMDESAVDEFIQYLKSFKIRFNKNGDIVVTRREYDQLDSHFRNSLKMIKAYEKSGNLTGVKDELCKIHYMIELINRYYLRNDVKNLKANAREVRKDMLDLRSVMLNVFQQHLQYVTTHEPKWNFQQYYDNSKYGKNTTIPQSIISSIGKAVITALS